MRFMIMVRANEDSEAGIPPDPDSVRAMRAYTDELARAGVLLCAEGLHPSADGTLLVYSGGTPRVMDGPFTEAKELVGGFWLVQVRSRAEAIQWALRIPVAVDGERVEIRQVYDPGC